MSKKEEPDNIMLRILQDIRADQIDMKERFLEMNERITGIEMGVGAINKRLDRVERDMDQVKKRLDLVDA